ncbi:MAG: NAD(P)/FAD-dependent oxidoreductase [Planctomycetes bacterium]|nr:NAD(P)/FAD-dependent oxidoreductase [Planctomycetota bacterium]
MQGNYDVVIVGAGPSGAMTARVLVEQGLRVLIIEKKRLPRYKICSGIIFRKSQDITDKYFGEIPEHAYAKPELLEGVRMWDSDGGYRDMPFSKDGRGAPNVWRSEFDNWLVRGSGAEVRDLLVLVDFENRGDSLALRCRDIRENKEISVTCNYLVSAEGGKSLIRAKLDPEFENGLRWFVAYQNYYKGESGLDPAFYHGFLDPQYGDVYAWFSVKDGLQIFGTTVKKGGMIAPYLLKYTDFLKNQFGLNLNEMVRKTGCVGNNMCPEGKFYPGKGNVLLVGEAGGFLNAFGEGISCALVSGLCAGEAIIKGRESGQSVLPIYTELTKHERRVTRVSWRMGAKMAGRDLMPI